VSEGKKSVGSILGEAARNIFRRPATIPYLGGELRLDPRNRGMLRYDASTCVNCGLCMKDCPTGAIRIENRGAKENRDMHAYLDMGKCIFCGQCGDSCAKNSITFSSESNLSEFGRDKLTVELKK